MPFSAMAELCPRACRALPGGSSDPEGRVMLTDKIEAIGRAPWGSLDALVRAIWTDHAAGRLADAGAQQLTLRIPSPARYDRRASLLHRRRLAASGGLPAQIAQHFTCGEQAVLRVITDEARIHGKCMCTHGELAGRAGVSVSTAKRAIATAIKLGLLHRIERRRPGQKSPANVLTVVSRELRAWIARGPRRHEHPPGVQNWTATDTQGFTKGLRRNVGAATAE